jgi:hypothetical protein
MTMSLNSDEEKNMAFEWPESRSENECDFVTGKKSSDGVEAKLIALRLSQSSRATPQVEMAFRVQPGQKAIPVDGVEPVDQGGKVVITARSLNGGAAAITFGDLKHTGFSISKLLDAYKDDPQATAVRQQITARMAGQDKAAIQAKQEEALTLLALQRQDLAALGGGAEIVKLVCGEDTFGNQTRIKVKYINPIPKEYDVSGLLDLTMGLESGALSGKRSGGSKAAQKPTGGTSAPPAKEVDDDVAF